MITYNMSREEIEALGGFGAHFETRLDGTTTKHVLGGSFKMLLDNGDESLTPSLVNLGFWESWITSWVTRYLRPGMQFVDVGANCGYYTLLAETLVGPYGFVSAYEPNPVYANLLKRSIDLNNMEIHVEELALWDSIGEAKLAIPGNLHGSASLVGDFPEYDTKTIEVYTSTLDHEVGMLDSPTIIKIDVEGAEEAVFNGGRDTLNGDQHVTLMLEWTPRAYSDKFFDNLKDWGTVTRVISTGSEIPVSRDFLDSQDDWSMIIVRRK